MIGKIKALGLACVAVAAMSASAAPAAHAGQFDIGTFMATLTAEAELEQEHIFSITRTGTLEKFPAICTNASLEAATIGTQINEATATATYGPHCTFLGQAAQVVMNGCKYTVTGAGQAANTARIDIVGCTTGKRIEIKTAICTLHIGAQNNLSHVVGTNQAGHLIATLSANVTGITAQQTGVLCPDGNLHQGTNAGFTGNTLLTAQEYQSGPTVTKHGHQYIEWNQQGAFVSVTST